MRHSFVCKLTTLFFVLNLFLSRVPFSLAATTESRALNVGFTIPTVGGGNVGGGGGCVVDCGPPDNGGGGNAAPVISSVVTTVTTNGATITWSASDDTGLAAVTLEYGTTLAYGTAATVVGSFSATLAGLTPGTQYFFLITATDTANKSITFADSFTTAQVAQAFTISNIQVTPGITDATVTWQTSAPADSQLLYGRTESYGSTASNPAPLTDHSVTIINLLPNTTYHFKISSTDDNGNQLDTEDAFFSTLPDDVPPPDVQNLRATAQGNAIQLTWTNPDTALFPDVSHIRIVRKVGMVRPATPNDGAILYDSLGTSFKDVNVLPNVQYSYTAFTFDTSNNFSSGSFVEGVQFVPGVFAEICAADGVDDDNNGLADCADPACVEDPVCKNDPGDDGVGSEVCDNGVDDDANGLADCADVAACSGFSGCALDVSQNQVDSNSTPQGSVNSSAKIFLQDVRFLAGARTLRLAVQGETVESLAGTQLSVVLGEELFFKKPQSMLLVINGTETHQFVYFPDQKYYYSDIVMPSVGVRSAFVQVDYTETENDVIGFKLLSLAWGDITDGDKRIPGAEIELLDANERPVPLAVWGQQNPFVTGANGNYGFVVENGTYILKITVPGYYDRISPRLEVRNNVINTSLELIPKPRPLTEEIDLTKGVGENVKDVAKNIADRSVIISKQLLQVITDARADEQTQKTVGTIVVPTVVGVSAVSFLSFISFSNLLPFLRLLFLQPLLLLGLKKREGWGQVYNALTKLPVDLATLRLVNIATNQVVQTKVTDSKGRYAFVAQPGTYRIEVQKGQMKFPSELLHGFNDDGRKTDIYHGETITVTEKDAVVTANIPLDPLGDATVPVRLRLQKISRFFKITLSLAGFALTLVSFYISPQWYVAALLVVHLVFLVIFHRLAIPPKIKSWGIVYESGTKNPVGRTVARLFNAQFNKLVATQITDAKGRYYFLAGDNKYYVTYEHPSYEAHQSEQVDLAGKEADTIALDVGLKKK